MFCVDASVFLSAAKGDEPYSKQSKGFLDSVESEGHKMLVPEILIPEVASGLFRATKNSKFSLEFVGALRGLPNCTFVPVDGRLADRAAKIICETGLRGADAIYVALAFEYAVPLVTLDKEQFEKGKKVIDVVSPALE
ncbi:MAG TPA: type II toxin-antitoxin system VapC family toxin [Candidatus Paceibacterota bacterium]